MDEHSFEQVMRIHYKQQVLTIRAQVNRRTGDLVQLEDMTASKRWRKQDVAYTLLAGTLWRPNRDLARRTDHGTQYLCFQGGYYDLMRSGWHIEQRYGTRRHQPGTEAQELARDHEYLRTTVVGLLSRGASYSDRQLWLTESMEPLIQEYVRKYDPRKVMALQDMQRGSQLTDSLGRPNVGAASLSNGNAIGNILERRQAIKYLARRMGERTEEVTGQIREIRDAYRRLWCGFHPSAAAVWAYEDAGFAPPAPGEQSPGWLEYVDFELRNARTGLPATVRRKLDEDRIALGKALESQLMVFGQIRGLPFRRNAVYVVRDLTEALACLHAGDVSCDDTALKAALLRLREGIRWFFVFDHLQMRVIAPLSLLIYDLKIRSAASPVPGAKPPKFVPSKSMAPRDFHFIVVAYANAVRRLRKCQDEYLTNPVLPRFRPMSRAVFAAMHEDDWHKVKTLLVAMADTL
jgi:hypothetical protein